ISGTWSAPCEVYGSVAIDAASMSTTLSGMDFAGPIGAVRVALVADENGDTQWVAFPKHSQLQNAVFNMAVAGRVSDDGDIAVMMVEAEAPEGAWEMINGKGVSAPTEEIVAEGLEAAKPFIKVLCDTQADLVDRAAKAPVEIPLFVAFQQDAFDAVKDYAETRLTEIFSIADKQ